MLTLFSLCIILGVTLYTLQLSLFSIVMISILTGMFLYVSVKSNGKNKKPLLLCLALFLSMVLGAVRMWMIAEPAIQLGNQAFTGVVKTVDERLDKTLLSIRIDDTDTVVQATLYEKQSVLPSDHISVRGSVELAQDFMTDTNRMFDYDQYLSSKGIDALVRNAKIVKIEEGSWSLSRTATQIRRWIAHVLGEHIQFPIDGIVAGMLVGFQGGIPQYLSDIFRNTGTLHTLVLSGYNVTVVGGFLGILLRFVPFRVRNIFVGIGIAALVLVSGAGVAAVRAGIMGGIALFAGALLQKYNALRALIISGLVFFFISPQTLLVDPGFHLSFLATLFIITLLPLLNQRLSFIPNGKIQLRELLILAFVLPLYMLPYMMYFSGQFPFVSPFANILLVPIIPILMLGGVAVLFVSLFPFVGDVVGGAVGFIGMLAVHALTWLGTFPQWNTPNIPAWGVATFYIVLFGTVFRRDITAFWKQL